MLCNIKPVPFHESDKHIFAKIPGGGGSGPPVPPPLDLPMGMCRARPDCTYVEADLAFHSPQNKSKVTCDRIIVIMLGM